MIGLFGLLVYFVIGAGVAAVERRKGEGWELTVIAACGAIAGAWVGRSFDLYVAFGEFTGLLCAGVGALGVLRVYRSLVGGAGARAIVTASGGEQVPSSRPEPVPPVPPDAAERPQSIFSMLAEAVGWGTLCAFTTGAAGFAGHLVGSRLYPQHYEQIPSDFFFVPLGMLVGFVATGVARLAMGRWGALAMAAFVGLVSVAYAGAMFQYSRVAALGESITATIEPDPVDAIACTPDKCEATDPPSQWYVTGRLRLVEHTGIGATIDRIEISSTTRPTGPVTPRPYTKEGAAEAARWRGPLVTLTGWHIPGPRHLAPKADEVYPIVYGYHTRDAASRRTIEISVYMTDRAGRRAFAYANWNVW